MRLNKGFTLVEILIVVIILGILAAIVIPQFTQASNDARESSLSSDLQTARSQLELYKVQHLERYPSVAGDGSADASVANFIARLTGKTDQDGTINATGALGPYLQKFPKNPFVSDAVADTVAFTETHDGSVGWWFNADSTSATFGEFHPADTLHTDMTKW